MSATATCSPTAKVEGCPAGLAPCTRGSAGRWPAASTATAEAGFLRDGGVGPVAGDAVNPSLGACRGIHAADPPATGPTPPSTVFRDLLDMPMGSDPFSVGKRIRPHFDCRYLTDVSTKVDTYRQHTESVRGGAVSECGVSAAWARGMPRAGWAGRPTPVLPCAQESAHEQAAAKPTRTYLRRPRTPTPPRQTKNSPLLLLLLPLPLLEGLCGCRAPPGRLPPLAVTAAAH